MCRPSRRSVTRPASRSARKCCDTAGCETFEPLTSPVAAISPSRMMRSNTARRVGSARVFITLVSWVAMVISIYKYLLMYMSTARSAGTGRKFAGKPRDHGALKGFRMIAKLLLQNTFFVVGMGVVLFATAGTLHWPAAWVYLATSAILGPACGLWLARTDPGLLAERMRLAGGRGAPGRR